MGNSLNTKFEDTGFHWARNALSSHEIEALRNTTEFCVGPGKRIQQNRVIENILIGSSKFRIALHALLPDAYGVRYVSFRKSNERPWSLPWHQDRVISVKQKVSLNGFSNWSQKAGIWHCEPPIAVLQNMLFVQILLDDIDVKKWSYGDCRWFT